MAVRLDSGRHCYADASLISSANKTLAQQDSDLELRAGKESIELPAIGTDKSRVEIQRVIPRNRGNKTEGNAIKGGMQLVDDCGHAANTIMQGAGRATVGVYSHLADNPLDCWLDEEGASSHGPSLHTPVSTETLTRHYDPRYTPLNSPDMMMMDIYAGVSGQPFPETFADNKSLRASSNDEGKPDVPSIMRRRLEATEQFDLLGGINRFAQPKVGEAYSVIADNFDVKKYGKVHIPWKFHWGAVVLQSGGDSVTLENFADSGGAGWSYHMYGPPTKRGQTFHEQQMLHMLGEDLPAYTLSPTTIRVRPAKQARDARHRRDER